jgi:HD-GYP domain-containing protein (c-di-GMP phosphodiesterase class II)
MLLPLSLEKLALHQPLTVNIWNARGMLLMQRGDVLTSAEQLERLIRHGPMVKLYEHRPAGRRYDDPPALGAVAQRHEAPDATVPAIDPATAWGDLHERLTILLHQGAEARDFAPRLDAIVRLARQALVHHEDDSLFVLVQMLFDRQVSYSATHALLSAVTCHLIAPLAGLSEDEQRVLLQAALTMNIGMSRLHDQLAQQKQPLDAGQREAIRLHPQRGRDMLRQLGIGDPGWLQLVLDHHESSDGKGYPAGKTELGVAQRVLHMVDLFVARISPRRSRRGFLPQKAVRDLYLAAREQGCALCEILIKTIGMYPPGSYVRLVSNEIGVVVRRGQSANTPMVMAIVGQQGMPLSIPSLRDTQRPGYAIAEGIGADDVKIRLNTEDVIKRM